MAAYCMFICRERKDLDLFRQYAEKARATLAPYDVRNFTVGHNWERVEGDLECEYLAIVEFGSYEQARAWYFSDEYQAIRPLRTESGRYDAFIFDGSPKG